MRRRAMPRTVASTEFAPERRIRMERLGIVAVISLGLSALVVGCGSTGVTTTAVQPPPTASTPSTPSAPSTQKAGIGDTIDLSDSASGEKIAVTLVKVVDPDSSNNEFETPPAGDRFESIQFRIVDTGSGSYQDDPLIEITAKDANGQSMQQDVVTSTAAGAQMPSDVNLAPGDTALGFVTFDTPIGDTIAQAEYSVNGGVLGTTGEWQTNTSQSQSSVSPPSTGQAAPPTSLAAPPPPVTTTTTTSSNSAQTVVEQYFAAINAHDYALAWSLGGKNIEQGSYDSFAQGFAGTSSDSVTIVSASGDIVTIELDATQTDGSHKYFAGTYTVENGAIVSADIH